MQKFYMKLAPPISKIIFFELAKKTTQFLSSSGRRYEVLKTFEGKMFFKRLDSKQPHSKWDMDLNEVYNAYIELYDFSTKNFKKYIPGRQSPARGLLIHLGLLNNN